MTDTHEIFAIRYGHHPRKAADNFLGGDPHDVLMPLDYFVWAIVGPQETIIVDTGFDEAVGTRRGRQIVKPVREGLAALGIAPDAIRTVIMSHLHYDHAGNCDLFPHARYHLQDSEMAYATGRCMCHPHLSHSFEEDYVVSMVRKVYAGRVTFHDGAGEIAPGVTVHHIGGHTKGLQCVRVATARGPVVLAADATHLYAHIDNGRVFPTTYNVAEVLEGYNTPEAARRRSRARGAGPRSRCAAALSCGEAGAGELDRAARCGAEGVGGLLVPDAGAQRSGAPRAGTVPGTESPRISLCPRLSRASTPSLVKQDVDGRDKPGHNG